MVKLGLVIDRHGGRWHNSLKEDYQSGYRYRIIKKDTRETIKQSFRQCWYSKRDAIVCGNAELNILKIKYKDSERLAERLNS